MPAVFSGVRRLSWRGMSHCSPGHEGLTELGKKNYNHLHVLVSEGCSLLCFGGTSRHTAFSITFLQLLAVRSRVLGIRWSLL